MEPAIHSSAALHADAYAAEWSASRSTHGKPAWLTGHHHCGGYAGVLVNANRLAVDGDREAGIGIVVQSHLLLRYGFQLGSWQGIRAKQIPENNSPNAYNFVYLVYQR
jgi:hypothetical protein